MLVCHGRFCHCCIESKTARISGVKCGMTTLGMLTILSTSLVMAEDFKTINGKEYNDATVKRVEPDGIVVKTKSGLSKVYFADLPKEVPNLLLPTSTTPGVAQREL